MANNCFFEMKVTGNKESVETLIKMLKWKDEFEESGLGRVYDIYEIYREEPVNEIVSVILYGDCAWSVLTAMRKYEKIRIKNLEDVSEQLNLVIEVFSKEPGVGFQEHVLIAQGDVITDDCVDYEEHWVEEFETIEEYNAEYDTNFTEDMVEDGYVCIGGFGEDYDKFNSHVKYFYVNV